MKKKGTILGIIGAFAFIIIKKVLNIFLEPNISNIISPIMLILIVFLLYCYITKDKK